jgi:hypothetical protein
VYTEQTWILTDESSFSRRPKPFTCLQLNGEKWSDKKPQHNLRFLQVYSLLQYPKAPKFHEAKQQDDSKAFREIETMTATGTLHAKGLPKQTYLEAGHK